MATLSIHHELSLDGVRLRLEGALDRWTARQVEDALAALPGHRQIVLDFRQVQPFSSLALAVVGRGLRGRELTLRVVGLSVHQERLLHYLGIDLAPAANAWEQAP